MRKILGKLRDAGLTLRLSKCYFFKTCIDYLGHEMSAGSVRPGKQKILAVSNFPTPTNVHAVRQFLGLCSYFRKYVQGFATLATPLTNLLKQKVGFMWNQEQQTAFEKLKQKLTERPVLALYQPDLETEIHTDTSQKGIGGILLQKQKDGNLRPVMYFDKRPGKSNNITPMN